MATGSLPSDSHWLTLRFRLVLRAIPPVLTESKTRTVSFRLTADEYNRFRELCSTCGTRSVSELVRAAVNSLLKQPAKAPWEALESRVTELEGRVNMLRLDFRKFRGESGIG